MTTPSKLKPPGPVNAFGVPMGFLGALAGWMMGLTGVEHNRWAVEMLDVQPDDEVLEIGFGPGVSIQLLAERATNGVVYGIDPSPVMLKQAARRNAAALESGRVALDEAGVTAMPFEEEAFDKVLSVNNVMMWPGPERSLREVYRVIKPGGLLVIALNPRWAKSADDVAAMGREIMVHAANAGFLQPSMELRTDLKPYGAVAVTCTRGR